MIIERQSAFTGITRTMDLPITEDEIARWEGGELIQVVWPELTEEQRCFLIDGTTQDEWDAFIPGE